MPKRTPTALIEFSVSHLECLHSQILFLKSAGAEIHLVLPDRLRAYAGNLDKSVFVYFLSEGDGCAVHWLMLLQLRRYLVKHNVKTVVFNTGEGNAVRNFSVIAPRWINYAGILHHAEKLRNSFTQFVIGRTVKKYFVMSDYLLEYIPRRTRQKVRSFSPIFLPDEGRVDVPKPKEEFWVCIPGVVEYRRRDYAGLVRALKTTPVDPAVRFIILGTGTGREGDELAFRRMVADAHMEEHFVFFEEFIPQNVFVGYLRQSDLILPLLHPGIAIYDSYRYHGISGTFNLAFGLGVPMLMDTSWECLEDFQRTSLFYQPEAVVSSINSLVHDRTPIAAKRMAIQSYEKFSFQYQRDRYIDFLAKK